MPLIECVLRFLILSDIHANFVALEAVLRDARDGFDRIICCGDLVGYNPYPSQVIAWARENCDGVIRGNHDKVVAGVEGLDWFNEVAQVAARWTMERLDEQEIAYLRGLPMGPMETNGFEICHGSVQDEDEYVISPVEAATSFPRMRGSLVFFGHTHLQGGFFARYGRVGVIPQVRRSERDFVIALEPDTLYLINPGAVGQPRDRDARAAYAIFDAEQRIVELRRTPYAIQKTAEDIRKAGLPDALAARLFHGV